MRSIEAALALDFVRRGAIAIPLVLVVMIGLPIWLFLALDRDGMIEPSSPEAIVLHVTLTLVMGAGAAVAVFHAHGKLARFFVRPISAMRLVACQMGLGMATVAAMYVIAVSLINLRGVEWPVLGPALFMATTMACSLAMIWSLEGSILLQLIGCTATSVPLVIWFSRCYGARIMGDWKVMWHEPTAGEALTLVGISVLAFVGAIVGVYRTRRGEVWNFAAFFEWWDRHAFFPSPTTFRSPFAAQAWCEWQQKLGPVPACVLAVALLIPGISWMAGYMPTRPMLEFMIGLPAVLLAVVMPLVYGLVVGNCSKESRGQMKQHLATRPVTDSFLAQAMLRTCVAALTLAWGTWLVGLAVFAGLAYFAGDRADVAAEFTPPGFQTNAQLFSFVLAYSLQPLASWSLTANAAALVATGRPWLLFAVLVGIFGLGPGAVMVHKMVWPFVVDGFVVLVGVIYLLGTVWAFVAAIRRRLVSVNTVVLSAAAWVAMTATMLIAQLPALEGDPQWAYHFSGFFALAVLPFTAMPLAVRWNRHR